MPKKKQYVDDSILDTPLNTNWESTEYTNEVKWSFEQYSDYKIQEININEVLYGEAGIYSKPVKVKGTVVIWNSAYKTYVKPFIYFHEAISIDFSDMAYTKPQVDIIIDRIKNVCENSCIIIGTNFISPAVQRSSEMISSIISFFIGVFIGCFLGRVFK